MPLTLRAWLRYIVPLTVLAAIAFLPLLYIASRVGPAQDLVKARTQVRIGWILASIAWTCQLLLVAGVAPAVRGLVRGQPLSQWRALADGAKNLARGFVPWIIVVGAVVLGGLALVVPGLLLLVLLSLTGASEKLGDAPPAALVDSVAIARSELVRLAVIVIAIIVVDIAICFAVQKALVPVITKKVPASKLLPLRTFVRMVPIALAVASPVAACALAAAHARFTARRAS